MSTKLNMIDISIEFPGVKALNHVSFTAETGKVHGLLGANGAGKSTLMKVLCGAYDHYTGEINLDGQALMIRTPKQAKDYGIQIVYQEVDTVLVSNLTVGENIMINQMVNDMGKKQFVNWKKVHQRAANILKSMNINISTKKLISELTLAEKQMVLIARSVSTDCKFLILDEPTAPLSQSETRELFRIVTELKTRNVGIIFISHRLPEVFEICDEITVMRNGQFVCHESTEATSQNKVIEHMLGKKLDEQFPSAPLKIGNPVLEVKGLHDKHKLRNINLMAAEGEIVGIAGLVGAGKTELTKALFGVTKLTSGEVRLKGKKLKLTNPYHAVKQGLALVPEERRKEGILVNESVTHNLTVANLNKFTSLFSFLNPRAERIESLETIKSLGIKTPSGETKVKNLSGGNQQKIAIGKWLISNADVYIFDEPTKGVDVGAKKDIFDLIVGLAQRGKVIIYASSELSEIMGISNRMYVLYDGQIIKELATHATNEEEILYYSTGGM